MKSYILNLVLPFIAFILLFIGGYFALFVAPKESFMGDVYRIMFVHVPSAWITLLAYVITFFASVVYLFTSSSKADSIAVSSAEIGVVFNTLLLISGSIWGKPTWGVWWTWDPRLTTASILFFAFLGYLVLRKFVEIPEKRATWSAIVAIIISVDIPIVWYSVKWWNSLHQVQSSPNTMGEMMVIALRLNAFAFLSFYLWFLQLRYRLENRYKHLFEESKPSGISYKISEVHPH